MTTPTVSTDAQFTRGLRDDRGRSGSGAAAHTGSDEAHMRAGQTVDDFLDGFFGGGRADLWARTGAQTFGDAGAKLDPRRGVILLQRLRVGVGDDEFNAFQIFLDHVVDGIAACPANTEHGDARAQIVFRGLAAGHCEIQCHSSVRLYCRPCLRPFGVPSFWTVALFLPQVSEADPRRHPKKKSVGNFC